MYFVFLSLFSYQFVSQEQLGTALEIDFYVSTQQRLNNSRPLIQTFFSFFLKINPHSAYPPLEVVAGKGTSQWMIKTLTEKRVICSVFPHVTPYPFV